MPVPLRSLLDRDSRARPWLLALGIYLLCALVFGVFAGKERLVEHTQFNHYAHLADAWLHGRQDLVNGAPAYAQGNDFAVFEGKTYISFPPFPAVLMLPFVFLAKTPENFQDGQFVILWLSGIGPAFLFLALEKLRRDGRSLRTEMQNLALALLFAFGTVYFFTAVEGTVWFAAHVVGVGLLAAYTFFSLGARAPFVSGLLLGAGWMTRPALLFTGLLFLYEATRAAGAHDEPSSIREWWSPIQKGKLFRTLAVFALPLLLSFALGSYTNYTRYRNPSPFAFGHEHLTVFWAERMKLWGLFHYHYLAKNLGIMWTSLPWLTPNQPLSHFKINEHGLALWFTSPFYLWLFWPKHWTFGMKAIASTALLPMGLDLLYQNSGWRQFGYRFSNDYSILLFVLLALGNRMFSKTLFQLAALWAVAWNGFGAMTFDKGKFDRYYFREGSQTVIYQPDDPR